MAMESARGEELKLTTGISLWADNAVYLQEKNRPSLVLLSENDRTTVRSRSTGHPAGAVDLVYAIDEVYCGDASFLGRQLRVRASEHYPRFANRVAGLPSADAGGVALVAESSGQVRCVPCFFAGAYLPIFEDAVRDPIPLADRADFGDAVGLGRLLQTVDRRHHANQDPGPICRTALQDDNELTTTWAISHLWRLDGDCAAGDVIDAFQHPGQSLFVQVDCDRRLMDSSRRAAWRHSAVRKLLIPKWLATDDIWAFSYARRYYLESLHKNWEEEGYEMEVLARQVDAAYRRADRGMRNTLAEIIPDVVALGREIELPAE